MARAVFQVQSLSHIIEAEIEMRITLTQMRSFSVTKATSALISFLQYNKPKERMEPIHHADAYEKSPVVMPEVHNTSDMSSAIIGKHLCTVDLLRIVSHAPVGVDSEPSDMATIDTIMKNCVDICMKAGQQYSPQTFDQQSYAIAQQSVILEGSTP
ncbi:Hypothetical predicted protein [Mytilus galloprovincialis]|uniref:Uncharacterized protein n=1 Tax=Mytilus galloprovincialis TaxID=29158 RepID=A0A8B6BZ81_MYTGA|nr:Hypothetical predicted protein [Mytilus galloprovincialis]